MSDDGTNMASAFCGPGDVMTSDLENEIRLSGEVGTSTSEDGESQPSSSTSGVFHVDTSLIPQALLDEQNELQGLGLNVFNQNDFEQGVMAQVDQALAKEEEERFKKIWQKEEKSVEESYRITKQELTYLEKILRSLHPHDTTNREAKRKRDAVQRQKENKLNQLKKLTARRKVLHLKLYGIVSTDGSNGDDSGCAYQEKASVDQGLLLGSGATAGESERERMIRLGEMTPFGTVVKSENKSTGATNQGRQPQPSTSQMSDFEKFLSEKDSSHTNKKSKLNRLPSKSSLLSADQNSSIHKKSLKTSVLSSDSEIKKDSVINFDPSPAKKPKTEKANFFDDRDKKFYNRETDFTQRRFHRKGKSFPRLCHNFSEDTVMSDEEQMYEDGDSVDENDEEYVPEDSGGQMSDADSDTELDDGKTGTKTVWKHPFKKHKPPPFNDDNFLCASSPKRKLKRDSSIKKTKDDGDEYYHQKRMKEHQKSELLLRYEREQQGLDPDLEDEEFEGGLRVPGSIWTKLFKYQKTGVRWLWELHCQQAGGIIGDEMGLGKTIQMIAFLAALKYSKLRSKDFPYAGLGPSVIVCPATVMHQWVKEFHKWAPTFRVAILHSSGSYSGKESDLVRSIVRCHGILITSFSTLVIQQDKVLPYNWHYVVLDEGHKIRNPDAQITQACKQFRTVHRIILSGSPVQNNLKELWSLFDFVFPGKLGMLPDFMQHFSVPIIQGGYSNATQVQVETAYKCACVLRDTINPFLLRRMKADVMVNIELPDKNEQVLFCRLTEEQRQVYQEYISSKECESILAGRYQIFAGLITLRKICNHPDLSTGGPRVFIGESTDDDETLEFGYWCRSGKMIVVEALLKLWKKQGHRVLLFSQSRAMLDILEKFTQKLGLRYLRMDGTTPISARQPLVNQFNMDSSLYVFLLTTRVGGLGVNLTGANRVIIFDPDWNPSTDTQARERAWRIGQKRQVTIYRLLTSGTIEEKIYHRQIFKQFLTNRVLKDPKQRRFFKSNDMYELFTLGDQGDGVATETSAIFAGTGSVIKIPKKVNRFDEMKKMKRKEEDKFEKTLDEDELNRMRELARKLSHRMEESKSEFSQESSNSGYGINSVSNTLGHGTTDAASVTLTKINPKPKTQDATKDLKPLNMKNKEKHKKKKRNHKDAKFEGERIPHLDKLRSLKSQGSRDSTDVQQNTQHDDYVLRTLFKKTGIQGALRHDKIMNSSQPDYALVEAEAEKVAKEAALALKKSRSNCASAMSGIPTWTGQNGGLSGRPRFGQKKNSLLVNRTVKIVTEEPSESQIPEKKKPIKKPKMFDGSVSGSVAVNSKPSMMSSDELLAKMRLRHHLSSTAVQEDGAADPLNTISPDDMELMTDIRNCLAFQCAIDGQATTQELLDQFYSRLPKGSSARFKAMLYQMCDFEKSNGIGIWRLKYEFR